MVTDADPNAPALRRLRHVAVFLVAAGLLAAGGWKLWHPDAPLTMLARTLPSPRAVRAGALLEIALGLWLLSGKSPKLAPTTAAAALIATGCLMAGELRRDRPLPCGCFPVNADPSDTAAVRRDLSIAIARNAFLTLLCGVAIGLAPMAATASISQTPPHKRFSERA